MYVFVLIFAMYPLTMTIGEYFGNMFFWRNWSFRYSCHSCQSFLLDEFNWVLQHLKPQLDLHLHYIIAEQETPQLFLQSKPRGLNA
jgi:hypothetical protein